MTYNFDPDLWYSNHRALLDERRRAGDMTDQEHERAVLQLDEEYDALVRRLDGSYQLPRCD